MNLLKSNLLLRSANGISLTRWNRNDTLKLVGAEVKYLSCNEYRCHPIFEKSPAAGIVSHETITYRIRSYSHTRFEKLREYLREKRMDFYRYNHGRQAAFSLYRTIEAINFQEICEFLQLPDTFNSWFVLTELHIWMIMSQLMNHQSLGLQLRNYLVEIMWFDVEERCRNLGPVQKKILKKQLTELYDRLPVTLLLYDEGLLSTDTVLATALWYKLFEKQNDDPIKLEVLVRYIRHQKLPNEYLDLYKEILNYLTSVNCPVHNTIPMSNISFKN